MTRLFSYCIPYDDGAAPNPFWGVCTLVICKPRIRRAAQIGDWIVGTGSSISPIGDASKKIVYAMCVTQKMTMRDYDSYTKVHLPAKIPRWHDKDPRRRLGDSIYDFSYDPPRLRSSVHDEANRARDLSGNYALLSDHFYYFGDKPLPLPSELLPISQQRQGHRSNANDPFCAPFLDWLSGLHLQSNRLYGSPQKQLFRDAHVGTEPSHSSC